MSSSAENYKTSTISETTMLKETKVVKQCIKQRQEETKTSETSIASKGFKPKEVPGLS